MTLCLCQSLYTKTEPKPPVVVPLSCSDSCQVTKHVMPCSQISTTDIKYNFYEKRIY